jgi:F-type H+-transporting ATPase subunit epsilon
LAAKTFHCRLITPVAKVLDEEVTYASVPAWDGLFGAMPGRAPMVAKLGTGELRLDFPDRDGARGGSRSFLVEDGFVQMVNDRMTILAARAIPVESIDAQAAQTELQDIERRALPTEAGAGRTLAHERREKDKAFARAKVNMARKFNGRI